MLATGLEHWGPLFIIFGLFIFAAPWLRALLRKPHPNDPWPEPATFPTTGGAMAYHQVGRGPDLVLIHGLGASSYCWRYLIPFLKDHYRITTIDLIGFGQSAKPDAQYRLEQQTDWIAETLKGLNLKPHAIVGSSLGGALALWLGLRHPSLAPRIITLAPATMGADFGSWARRWAHLADRLRQLLVNRLTMPWMVTRVAGTAQILNAETLRHYLRPYQDRGSLISFALSLASIGDRRMPQVFSRLDSPVLILWGPEDRQVQRAAMTELKSCLKNATFEEFPGRHHPQEQFPEELSKRILVWLSTRQTT